MTRVLETAFAGLLPGSVSMQGCAQARAETPDPLDRHLRLYAEAQLFNGQVLSSTSATASLQAWCKEHDLAPDAKIVAQQVPGADNPMTDKQRSDLQVGKDEPIRY